MTDGRRVPRRRGAAWLWLMIIVVVAVIGILSVEGARWRAKVVWRKAVGGLPEVAWTDLVAMLRPGSGFWLVPLASGGSPYQAVTNPFESAADLEAGKTAFERSCAGCHGLEASGEHGPELRSRIPRLGPSEYALYRTIREGIPGSAMQPMDLPARAAWQIVAYVKQLRRGEVQEAARTMPPPAPVSAARLAAARSESGQWLTYSGAYDGWRYSLLDEITADNVGRLSLLWTHHIEGNDSFEATPLVLDGWLFFSEPVSNRVVALEAATGRVLWTYTPDLPRDLRLCCGGVTRGVAALDSTIFLATNDAHLIALDVRTGRVRWNTEVAVHADGYSMTGAPLAVEGKVLVGVGGGEFGIRGFVDAYDAATGRRLWRFHTTPGPGEPGSDSWTGDAWKTGGGPTWMTGSYDPGLRLVYWGTGNPGPDHDGAVRPGDNLFTASMLALDVDSGRLAWHFQFTPHDQWDWDANHVPILADAPIDGVVTPLLAVANKNGFYYVLNRRTGAFLRGVPFAWQTWADSLDRRGRPILKPGVAPTPEGVTLAPANLGATNWWPPSYNPKTGLVYVPARDDDKTFFRIPETYRRGELYTGGTVNPAPAPEVLAIRALDLTTGERRWEHRFPTDFGIEVAGTLTTAGGLVFGGAGGAFVALDAANGELLWSSQLGRQKSAPITWAHDGRQRLTVAAGRVLYTFGLR